LHRKDAVQIILKIARTVLGEERASGKARNGDLWPQPACAAIESGKRRNEKYIQKQTILKNSTLQGDNFPKLLNRFIPNNYS
jgi:hypothetical protein